MLPRGLAYYLGFASTYRLSEPELRRLQQKRLRRVLGFAYSSIPHYRETFRRLGLSPESIRTVEDLRLLPAISRKEVVSGLQGSLLPKDYALGRVKRGSGTTGRAMVFTASPGVLDVRLALNLRRLTIAGARPWTRVATLWGPSRYWRRTSAPGEESTPTTNMYEFGLVAFGRPLPNIRAFPLSQGVTEVARSLAMYRPGFIISRASHLRRVGERMRELGLHASPHHVSVASEVTTPAVVRDIESLLGTAVVRGYGSTEFGPIGGECEFRRGIHLSEDALVCEVLKDGEPVAPGETGELVLTSFYNGVMPLIRYRTGDLVTLAGGGRCGCGSSQARLKDVQGREDGGLVTASGVRLLPLETAEFIDSGLGLRDYQLVQLSLGELVLKTKEGAAMGGDTIRKLREYLEGALGTPVVLRVEPRTDDELWAKAQPIVSAA